MLTPRRQQVLTEVRSWFSIEWEDNEDLIAGDYAGPRSRRSLVYRNTRVRIAIN